MIGSNNQEVINSVIGSFVRQNEDLVKSLTQLIYYFRGALTRDDIWSMSYAEREIAIEFLNKRFEEASEMFKRKIPVFI